MIGIYCIEHIESGKKYIGKSVDVERRLAQHKHYLLKPVRDMKATNRHLYNAVQKHGWEAFKTYVCEHFDSVDEELIASRELLWMDLYDTCDRNFGYNLRRDSSTKMIVHEETRAIQSEANLGFFNPNFANNWTDKMKQSMSEIAKSRHKSGLFYGEEWRKKQGLTSSATWKNLELKAQMAKNVSLAKQKYDFLQFTREGVFLKRWSSILEIVESNPGYKWQNIYSVCNGYKKTYMGFKWQKELKI